MEYFTSGKQFFPGFTLPLKFMNAGVMPAPEDGYYAFLLFAEGIATISDDENSKTIPGPLCILIKPGHRIRSVHSDSRKTVSVIFRPEAVNSNAKGDEIALYSTEHPDYFFFRPFAEIPEAGYSCQALDTELCGKLSLICCKLGENLETSQGKLWPCMSRSYFLELLILLDRAITPLKEARPITVIRAGEHQDPVIEYLHTSYNRAVSLDSIARKFATNRTSLNRRFNLKYGMPVMAYLNAIRMDMAASLLRNTELAVQEIASRTGFSDDSYFSRAFKKKFTLSPLLYRKSFPSPYG